MKLRLTSVDENNLTKYIEDLTPHFNIIEQETETKNYIFNYHLIELNTIQDLEKVIKITGHDAFIEKDDYISDLAHIDLTLTIYDDYME